MKAQDIIKLKIQNSQNAMNHMQNMHVFNSKTCYKLQDV